MAVRVDELTTDVSVEGERSAPESGAAPVQAPSRWDSADAFRAMREAMTRDAERTSAEAYSD